MPSLAGQPSRRSARKGGAVADEQVVGHLQHGAAVLDAGRKDALLVAEHGHDPGLVVGGDGVHPAAKAARHLTRIAHEVLDGLTRGPAATVLQGLAAGPSG